jgi:4-hydroxy-3-methylbut-2-enyl diphosphate reductase
VGHTEGNAVVLRDAAELSALDLNTPVSLFSQTTMNPGEFIKFEAELKTRMKEEGLDPDKNLRVHNTICRQVSNREKYLQDYVSHYDLVIFVSGKKSSNGKALFGICREINPNTHFISKPEESDGISLEGISSIGICGATSSPLWLLTAVRERIENRINIS